MLRRLWTRSPPGGICDGETGSPTTRAAAAGHLSRHQTPPGRETWRNQPSRIHGGNVHTQAGIAKRWGVSESTVHEMLKHVERCENRSIDPLHPIDPFHPESFDTVLALPLHWGLEPASQDPGTRRWRVTARHKYPSRGQQAESITGEGDDERAAYADLRTRLKARQR